MPSYTIIELDTVDSTNNWAKREITACSPNLPTFIRAREQTGGRGRGTNKWVSPKDQNLYLTIVQRIQAPMTATLFSETAALTLVELLRCLGLRASLRWPNDICVRGEKIGGLLVEGTSFQKSDWVILGIGLNVMMDESILRTISQPATSIHLHCSSPHSLQDITARSIDALCTAFLNTATNPEKMHLKYLSELSWMKNHTVSLETTGGIIQGTISGFSPEGFIMIKDNSGDIKIFPQAVIVSPNTLME